MISRVRRAPQLVEADRLLGLLRAAKSRQRRAYAKSMEIRDSHDVDQARRFFLHANGMPVPAARTDGWARDSASAHGDMEAAIWQQNAIMDALRALAGPQPEAEFPPIPGQESDDAR